MFFNDKQQQPNKIQKNASPMYTQSNNSKTKQKKVTCFFDDFLKVLPKHNPLKNQWFSKPDIFSKDTQTW